MFILIIIINYVFSHMTELWINFVCIINRSVTLDFKPTHYENLSLKMTLKNHSYYEIQYYKRKYCTEIFSVPFKCNFQRCFCLI